MFQSFNANSSTEASKKNTEIADRITKIATALFLGVFWPLYELARNWYKDAFTLRHQFYCYVVGIAICAAIKLHIYKFILTRIEFLAWAYPHTYWWYIAHVFVLAFSPFYFYGAWHLVKRIKDNRRFQDAMENSGLKSKLGRFPTIIDNVPFNEECRKLIVKKNGIPASEFQQKKDWIEAGLQIFAEEINDKVQDGKIEIIYSDKPLTKELKLMDEFSDIPPHKILIGKSRSKTIYTDFKEHPHFLVAGSTGAGKSTFLRNMIFTLLQKEKDVKIKIIDLKNGLEFENLFSGFPNVEVVNNFTSAMTTLSVLATRLEKRSEFLKLNKYFGIDDYFKKISFSERSRESEMAYRFVVVVDEAAELCLSSSSIKTADLKNVKSSLSKIARLGSVNFFLSEHTRHKKSEGSRICRWTWELSNSRSV